MRPVSSGSAGASPYGSANSAGGAWSIYEQTPMPTTKLEEWRYTDLAKKLDLDAFRRSQAEAVPDDPEAWPEPLRATMEEDREASGHIVVIDGHVAHADIDPGPRGSGRDSPVNAQRDRGPPGSRARSSGLGRARR